MTIDCKKCVNRGKVFGLSQETYCSQCIHSDSWKKDHYDDGEDGQPKWKTVIMPKLTINKEAFKKFIDDEEMYSVDAGERPISEFNPTDQELKP